MTAPLTDDEFYERQAAGLLGSGAPLDMQGIRIAMGLTRVGSWKAVGDHPATASVNSIVNTYAPALVAEVERLRAVIDEFIAAEDAGSGEAEGRRRYDAWDALVRARVGG